MRERERSHEERCAQSLTLELPADVGRHAEKFETALREGGDSLAELRSQWAEFEADNTDFDERIAADPQLLDRQLQQMLARRVAFARVVDDLLRIETGEGLHKRFNDPGERSGPEQERPPLLFPNQLPHELPQELREAQRMKVAPVAAADAAQLARLAQSTVKWVMTADGGVFFGPVTVKHSVLSQGRPVLSAGEAELVPMGRGTFFVASFNNHSGHFKPTPRSTQLAEAALKKLGFTVPATARKERT